MCSDCGGQFCGCREASWALGGVEEAGASLALPAGCWAGGSGRQGSFEVGPRWAGQMETRWRSGCRPGVHSGPWPAGPCPNLLVRPAGAQILGSKQGPPQEVACPPKTRQPAPEPGLRRYEGPARDRLLRAWPCPHLRVAVAWQERAGAPNSPQGQARWSGSWQMSRDLAMAAVGKSRDPGSEGEVPRPGWLGELASGVLWAHRASLQSWASLRPSGQAQVWVLPPARLLGTCAALVNAAQAPPAVLTLAPAPLPSWHVAALAGWPPLGTALPLPPGLGRAWGGSACRSSTAAGLPAVGLGGGQAGEGGSLKTGSLAAAAVTCPEGGRLARAAGRIRLRHRLRLDLSPLALDAW